MPGSESGFDSDKSERTCPGLDLFAPNSKGGGCNFGGMVADRRILGSMLNIVRPNDVADGQSRLSQILFQGYHLVTFSSHYIILQVQVPQGQPSLIFPWLDTFAGGQHFLASRSIADIAAVCRL